MSKVDIMGKWDIENEVWFVPESNKAKGRSLAIANYEPIINSGLDSNDYLIICIGFRLENVSINKKTISDKQYNINQIINYFEKTHKNIYIKCVLFDSDAPLKESGRKLGQYIDSLAAQPNTNSINIIGFSKGGVMCFDMTKSLKSGFCLQKTNLFTIATPFTGTLFASPKLLFEQLNEGIQTRTGNQYLSNAVTEVLKPIYGMVSSNSHMDYDIAIPHSIPEELLDFYDPSLIENIFAKENLLAIKQLLTYRNIYTGITKSTLKECLQNRDLLGVGLCLLNDIIYDEPADGFITLNSQQAVEQYFENIATSTLYSTTHSVFSNPRALTTICSIVNDTIDETDEKKAYILKKHL